MMTNLDIIALCHRAGVKFPESYMEPNWMPHNWVFEALHAAYDLGYEDGDQNGTTE